MKGSFIKNRGAWLRNGLVIFQFMISIILMVGTMVVGRQLNFMQHKNLGFDKEHVLMVNRAFLLREKSETFIEELRRMPEVKEVAGTNSRIGNSDDVFGRQFLPDGSDEVLTVKSIMIDDDFAQTIGFELKEGRLFAKETNDSLSILLNETAARTMDLKDPIGRKLWNNDLFRENPQHQQARYFTVIGIVKNFNFQSLRDEITPLVMFNLEALAKKPTPNFVAVRLKESQLPQAITKIQNKWSELVHDQLFQYEFLDEGLMQGYAEEQRSGKMFAMFSGLAIIIACVGLFGLSAYTTGLRIKEVGIRKVLGSTVTEVVVLLSKDFTKLVLMAFVLSVPFSWWMMDTWLKGFAYHIDLGISSFIFAGLLALGIAWLTVSYQSIKAAVVNPVKSLKSE